MDVLTVAGNMESLKPIRDCVTAAANAGGLDKIKTNRLRLAVDEIASNSIMHGYEEAGISGNLYVHTEVTDGHVKVVLEDEAGPFDPSKMGTPDHVDLPLGERPIGGLGIHLTIQGVDEFSYERAGDRNRTTFVVHRNPT